MKILHVTPNYPTPEYPIFGLFVKEQVESLQKIGVDCDVLNCDGQNKGFKKYITYLPKIWWKAMFGGRISQASRRFKRNMRFFSSYPGKVIWEPIVRVEHFIWKELKLWRY